ncbi:hypothetical protein GGR57DRAFT_506803 [Xylariaceae sp. FL1272]|nr:hypothetical protein GGR57DRAFT_506803 [Xylariaceae sp. FL1272]
MDPSQVNGWEQQPPNGVHYIPQRGIYPAAQQPLPMAQQQSAAHAQVQHLMNSPHYHNNNNVNNNNIGASVPTVTPPTPYPYTVAQLHSVGNIQGQATGPAAVTATGPVQQLAWGTEGYRPPKFESQSRPSEDALRRYPYPNAGYNHYSGPDRPQYQQEISVGNSGAFFDTNTTSTPFRQTRHEILDSSVSRNREIELDDHERRRPRSFNSRTRIYSPPPPPNRIPRHSVIEKSLRQKNRAHGRQKSRSVFSPTTTSYESEDDSESRSSNGTSSLSMVVRPRSTKTHVHFQSSQKGLVVTKRDRFMNRNRDGRVIWASRRVSHNSKGPLEDRESSWKNAMQNSSFALTRYHDENGQLRFQTLGCGSPSFLALLREIGKFKLYDQEEGGISVFVEPFVDIYYRREGLRDYLKNTNPSSSDQDSELRDRIACARTLVELLENEFAEISQRFDSFTSANPPKMVRYSDLWMIYRPGSLVFTNIEGQPPRAIMLDSVTYNKSEIHAVDAVLGVSDTLLHLHGWYIDFHVVGGRYDGKFGRRNWSTSILSFKGEIALAGLSFIPEALFNNQEMINQLKLNGQSFWQFSGPSFREFHSGKKSVRQAFEHERIIIDASISEETKHKGGIPYAPNSISGTSLQAVYDMDLGGRDKITSLPTLQTTDEKSTSYSLSWFREYDVIDPGSTPNDIMLLVCPPTVRAFSLREKTWSHYLVSRLRPVQFQENAWSRLVVEQEYKDVVQAMVNSHLRQSDGFEDLVAGKGGGVVILLHGPPGVGKTLTAESVAESVNKPLYMVTAGDLGTDPEQLEPRLSNIFKLALQWDAILLLDEADVFLQDRDYENLIRNALVSIFLRTLEYFKGIMILTSNRVGTFDQAFQSRIHITLGIPEFDETTRKQVWKIFLTDLGRRRRDGSPPLLSIEECKTLGRQVLDSWAREPMNGRQIRNCVRSALALAQDKGEIISATHINTVIRLGKTFNTYLNKLQKMDLEEVAQVKGDRLAEMRSLVAMGDQSNGSKIPGADSAMRTEP